MVTALLLALAPSAASDVPRILNTPHFSIVYAAEDESDARLVAGYAEKSLSRIENELEYEPVRGFRRVKVLVYSSRRDFVSETGVDRKKLIVGRAWSGSEEVEIDASGAFAMVERVVAHEVAHIVIARILGRNVHALPLWANEGIARTLSGESGKGDDERVGEALSMGRFIPLREIAQTFPLDEDRSELAYAEGGSFISYVRDDHGRRSLASLLKETSATGGFDEAVMETTGLPLGRLERRWRAAVSEDYAGGWLGRNVGMIVGVGMALLCVAAYAAVRARMRRHAIEWAEDDYDDGLDYGPPPE